MIPPMHGTDIRDNSSVPLSFSLKISAPSTDKFTIVPIHEASRKENTNNATIFRIYKLHNSIIIITRVKIVDEKLNRVLSVSGSDKIQFKQ